MALLFGCVCNQPKRLHDAITANGGLLSKSRKVNRWGIGYAQSGQLLLSRHPKTSPEFTFEKITEHIQADYVIGAAEDEDGLLGNANTQPFRYHSWLFAQSPKPTLDADGLGELKNALPGFLQRSTKGRHPSEILFHSFLAELHESKKLDDARMSSKDAFDFYKQTLKNVQEQLKRAPSISLEALSGNTILTNSRIMLAIRCSQTPMYFTQFKELQDHKRPETEFRSLLVWSEATPPSDEGGAKWEEIKPNEALLISRDLIAEKISF